MIGGICRETKDTFLAPCPDNKRDAPTLIDIIERHVNKDTTIITDCWRAYDGLMQQGWHHLTVNHQYNFVDPETQAHTQTIESTWWQIKRSLPATNSRHDGGLLLMFGEFLYRRKHREEDHLLVTFLRHCGEIYPLISLFSNDVLHILIADIKVAKWHYLGVVGDETRDMSNREQLNICMRSVDRNFVAYEDPIGFISVSHIRQLHGNGDGGNTAVTAGIPRFFP